LCCFNFSGGIAIANYSLDCKIGEIIQGTERAECGLPPAMGRSAKKGDVFRLGCLLLSLFEGSPVTTILPVPPSTASKELQDFFHRFGSTSSKAQLFKKKTDV
jgi:hypothetical protein